MVKTVQALAVALSLWTAAGAEQSPPLNDISRIDLGKFARVVTWDPERMTGTAAKRNELPRADEVYLYRELRSDERGRYRTPINANGWGCIGLRWEALQFPQLAAIEFDDDATTASVEDVRVQVWEGDSAWQGTWKNASRPVKKVGNRLVCRLDSKDTPRGTEKIRWLLANVTGSPLVRKLSVYGPAAQTAAVRIERVPSRAATACGLTVFNGEIVGNKILDDSAEPSRQVSWDMQQPLRLNIRYNEPAAHKGSRTVLGFRLSEETVFGVAIEDLLSQDAVYVPHAGVFVTLDPPKTTLENYLQRNAGKQTVLDRVRQLPDQSFDQALAHTHHKIQDRGPMMVSLAHDNRKFYVHRNGIVSFQLGDQPDDPDYSVPFFRVGEHDPAKSNCPQLQPRFGSDTSSRRTRHLDGGWLPVPTICSDEEGVVYRQKSYVAPIDKEPPAGAPRWVRYRAVCVSTFEIENTKTAPAEASLALNLFENTEKNLRLDWKPVDEGAIATLGDRLVAFVEIDRAGSLPLKIDSNKALLSGQLSAKETARCTVYLPAWKLAPDDYRQLANPSQWLEPLRAYWENLMAGSMQIELPSELLSNVIRASQVHIMLAARNEDAGSLIVPWISSDRYGLNDSEAHAVVRGMDMMGHHEFARRGLERLLRLQKPTGELTQAYTLIGTGENLWTTAEYFQRTGDRAWIEAHADQLVRECNWILKSRQTTERLDLSGQRMPESGLMPPGVTGDWKRFAYRFFNEAQYCAGLREAGQMLAQIGHPQASVFQHAAEAYRQDVLRAYRWTQLRSPVVPLGNGNWIPYYPTMLCAFGPAEQFYPEVDHGRSFAYAVEVGAHHLVATRILDPDGEDAPWIMDHMEDVAFLHDGWSDYGKPYPEEKNRENWFSLGGFAKCQPYYCRIAEIYAMRDDVKPFLRAYFNALASLLSTENLSLWEHFINTGGWNKTHETGWFLAQSRLMLVMERGEQLWLAPFVPHHWMHDGMRVVVRQAPTRFGCVGFTLVSHVGEDAIEGVIDPPTRSTPHKIVLRVRHPDGKPIRSVTVNGKPHKDFDTAREIVNLSPTDKQFTVSVRYHPVGSSE